MNILILSYGKYPNEDAGSVRQHLFAKMMHSLGNDIFVIGMGESGFGKEDSLDEINYTSFRDTDGRLKTKLTNFFGYKKKLVSFLEGSAKKYDAILAVDIPLNALIYIKKYGIRNGIRMIHDSVEWYSPKQFTWRILSPQFLIKEFYNRKLIDENFRVIAISRFLEKHFKSKGCKTVRIPPVIDKENLPYEKRIDSKRLTLIYAGAPVKKDYLAEIIHGIASLDEDEINKIELRILGVKASQLVSQCDVEVDDIDKIGNSLRALGRVKHEEVLRNLEEADFSVLLRPKELRYTKAGFPTKVVESLASGTPVICNITSDLDEFIEEGKTGIIVDDCTSLDFMDACRRALALSEKQKKEMYQESRKCAEENFDISIYEDYINQILK